ncbi:homeobox-DDT domain protein RLT1-like [Selaginella moellendorffii]|uniref:homeobox-DDT domain protein RLT1-like n=1 Tax=Selaginella moellendorffii TaxID=88036 RepID=UPI000D1CD570|nr:homeobox-DDT domain protein RLT1-like [Selaginella moellendorffii]|eukprot:XP_024544508.1 homeobox-DDT domain protein RLT1-like [Selaginella moellendorffii]
MGIPARGDGGEQRRYFRETPDVSVTPVDFLCSTKESDLFLAWNVTKIQGWWKSRARAREFAAMKEAARLLQAAWRKHRNARRIRRKRGRSRNSLHAAAWTIQRMTDCVDWSDTRLRRLKRQLWEEVQIDKSRLKEECSKAEAAKVDETNLQQQQVDEKPLLQALENGSQEAQEQQLDGDEDGSSNPAQALSEDPNERQQKCASQHSDRSRADMKADIRLRAEKLYVIRSLPLGLNRRHNRYWQFVTSSSGHDPGCRRIYFESHEDGHWEVIDTEEALNALMNFLDIRGTREANLFVALKELEGSLRQAMSSSSTKQNQDHHQSHHTGNGNGAGVQAGAASGNGNGNDSCEGSPSSSAVVGNGGKDSTSSDARVGSLKVELGRSASENSGAMERYKDMERWLWRHCSVKALQRGGEKRRESESDGMIAECESCHDLRWAVDKHCPFCHSTGEEDVWSDFSQHVRDCEQKMISRDPAWRIQGGVLPPRIQLLKKLLFLVEICIPCEALKPAWSTNSYRKAWCQMLKVASSAGEIL